MASEWMKNYTIERANKAYDGYTGRKNASGHIMQYFCRKYG